MKLKVHKHARALIFDMDGTLADSMPIHYRAWKLTAAEYGFEYTEKSFYETAGMPTKKIVPLINSQLGLNLDAAEFSRRKEEIFLENIKDIKSIPAVTDIVKKYHGKLPMSIGTGGKKRIALLTLEMLGLKKYFDIIISAEDVQNHQEQVDEVQV